MSTYNLLGLPDVLVAPVLLVFLSLSLAPWFGGHQIGTIKVPAISERAAAVLKIAGPLTLAIGLAGYFPAWEPSNTPQIKSENSTTPPQQDQMPTENSMVPKLQVLEQTIVVDVGGEPKVFGNNMIVRAIEHGAEDNQVCHLELLINGNEQTLFAGLKAIPVGDNWLQISASQISSKKCKIEFRTF